MLSKEKMLLKRARFPLSGLHCNLLLGRRRQQPPLLLQQLRRPAAAARQGRAPAGGIPTCPRTSLRPACQLRLRVDGEGRLLQERLRPQGEQEGTTNPGNDD